MAGCQSIAAMRCTATLLLMLPPSRKGTSCRRLASGTGGCAQREARPAPSMHGNERPPQMTTGKQGAAVQALCLEVAAKGPREQARWAGTAAVVAAEEKAMLFFVRFFFSFFLHVLMKRK